MTLCRIPYCLASMSEEASRCRVFILSPLDIACGCLGRSGEWSSGRRRKSRRRMRTRRKAVTGVAALFGTRHLTPRARPRALATNRVEIQRLRAAATLQTSFLARTKRGGVCACVSDHLPPSPMFSSLSLFVFFSLHISIFLSIFLSLFLSPTFLFEIRFFSLNI